MRGQRKARGLASRPTTANNTRSTTSMSGGKLVSMNGDAFVMINKPKVRTLHLDSHLRSIARQTITLSGPQRLCNDDPR